jgi:mTERF domain-containing protein
VLITKKKIPDFAVIQVFGPMFHLHRLRALLHLNNLPQTSKCHLLLLQSHFLNPFSFSTTTPDSDQQTFTISYLTNTCGLSPQDALKLSKRLRFKTPQKPDSFITFFKNHGFSIHNIQSIILKDPELLVSNPIKSILPKFQFLASKGASPSDIVATVTRCPRFLRVSLDKHITPAFDLVRSFCPSDQKAIDSIIVCPTSISDSRLKPNVKFLIDYGVTGSNIYHLLRTRPSIICSTDLKNAVEEIKELGFDPSKGSFSVALLAKRATTKSQWDAKVDVLKSWGCSEDEILDAFKRHPNFMLRSPDKLNAVMSFWVDGLGWDPSVLLAKPVHFGFSIEKRLSPRGSIVKYLLSKGLLKERASLCTPFNLSDEDFQRRYVKRFAVDTSRLLGEC